MYGASRCSAVPTTGTSGSDAANELETSSLETTFVKLEVVTTSSSTPTPKLSASGVQCRLPKTAKKRRSAVVLLQSACQYLSKILKNKEANSVNE